LLALIYFIPCFFAVDFAHLSEMNFTFDALAAIVQLSVLASVVAFIFYSHSVKVLGVTRAGVFCYIIPVLTALFAFVVIDEKLTALQWLSMAVVILGLFVSQVTWKKNI
jgi:drug/metabolite transporter (DMT)-like permease